MLAGPVIAPRKRFEFGAREDHIVIVVCQPLGRAVIDVVEVPADEGIAGLDQVIDRHFHSHRTCAPRLPAFDNDLDRLFFK